MSQELLSVSPVNDHDPRADGVFRSEGPDDSVAIRAQARGIIESVLAQGDRADSDAAARLHLHVCRYPDEPERALLEHLMETARLNRAKDTAQTDAESLSA